MLIKGLPRDALVRTPVAERGRDPWTAELELMAQLVEVVSVSAAEMRLRKPIKVPRPPGAKGGTPRAEGRGQVRRAADTTATNPYAAAIAALGGAQPSAKRELLAAPPEVDADGMTPPAPRGSYLGAMAQLAAHRPRSRGEGTA